MPLATSPYQPNDYTALKARQPYRLNIQAVAQTAMALDQFWKAGAQRVKSAYDSALNLNLTSDENKAVKDKFMEDAQKELTKLSSMDLSQPDVQRQGLAVFKPIFQDKAIMQDDYLTKLKGQIFSEAEEYKRDPKTKGAGFHMDNLAYALQGFQGFNNKTARNQIGDVYERAKDSQYIPFYDDSKEKIEILKACKGNKLSNMTNNGPYLSTYSDNSLYQSKLYGCLDSALSQQARQQTRISGSVRYGHDYEAVRNDYISSATEKKEYYETQKSKYVAQREALSKVAGNEEEVKQLDAQIKLLGDNVEKLDKELATYPTWTPEFMRDNYEDLAANAFFKRANGAFAAAFATEDIQNTLKADPIYITHYVQNELNKRQAAGAQDAIDLENLKFQHKLLLGVDEDGKKLSGDALTRFKQCVNDPNCRDKQGQFLNQAFKEPATTANKIRSQINDFTGQKLNIIKDLKNDPTIQKITGGVDPGDDALTYNEENYKKMWSSLNEYVKTADNSDPNKQRIIDVTNKLLELENRKTTLKSILDDASAQVGAQNPEIQRNYEKKSAELLSSTKAEKLFDGSTISAQRAASVIAGTDPELSIVPYTSQNYGPGATPSATLYQVINKDGKQVGWFDTNKNIIEGYKSLNTSREGSYQGALDKYLGENTAVQKMGLSTGDLFTKGSSGEQYLNDIFGNSLGIIGDSASGNGVVFNSIGGLDPVTGKVIVQATDKDGPISFKDLRDAAAKSPLASSFYGEEVPGNPNAMMITLPQAVGAIKEPLYADVLRMQLNYLDKRAATLPNTGIQMQVGKSRSGISYGILVKKNWGSKTPVYTILANGEEMPAKNSKQIDPKENILIQLDRLLEGKLNEEPQPQQ